MNLYNYISEHFLKELDTGVTKKELVNTINASKQPTKEDSYLPKSPTNIQQPNNPEVQDPNQIDPNQQDETLDIQSTIGRTYELKKIYAKLLSISKLLDNYSGEKFEMIRKDIDEALDLFDIIVTNLTSFQEKIDAIIVEYYNFMNDIIKTLEILIKSKDNETK